MISMFAVLLRVLALASGLHAEAPFLTRDQCVEQATAAVFAETKDLPAELALAIAYRESRYENLAKPQCGVLQVAYLSRAECAKATGTALGGYRAGAKVYGAWGRYCRSIRRRRGVTVRDCMLNGAAEGGVAARRGWGVKCGRSGRKRCDRGAGPVARARRIASYAADNDARW